MVNSIDEQQEVIDNLENAAETHGQIISEIEGRLESQVTNIQNISRSLRRQERQSSLFKGRMQNSNMRQKQQNRKIKNLSVSQSKHQTQLQHHETQIQDQETEIQNQREDILTQNTQIQNQETHIQNQGIQIQKQGAQIQNQGKQIQSQNTQIQNQGALIDNQESQIQNHEAQLQNQESRIHGLQTRQNQHDDQISALKCHHNMERIDAMGNVHSIEYVTCCTYSAIGNMCL